MAVNRRHSGGMDMSGMDMGMGVPDYFTMQKLLWVVIGSVIAFATLINVVTWILAAQRLRSLTAKPHSLPWIAYATATATVREVSQASFGLVRIGKLPIRTPSMGQALIGSSWLAVVVAFCIYGYDTTYQWAWEDIAYRCGCIAQSQLPLIFLMASKQNIVGYLSGYSYERLNWLHRWVARVLWINVTMHIGFWFRSWARYNYILVKLRTDYFTQTGFACYMILTAILLSSFWPIRCLSYEVFVTLHIVLFAGLLGAAYMHVQYSYAYVWFCVGIFFLDRFSRLLAAAWANFSFLHGRRGFWANSATLTSLPGNVTRVTIDNPVANLAAGQDMVVSCHAIAPLQAHPFTIASLPSDKKLEFFIGSQKGGTRRLNRWASKYQRLPDTEDGSVVQKKYIGLEGPYGQHRPLQQFDSVVFIGASTGATFTAPLMRDLVQRWNSHSKSIVTKRIKFVWVIKALDRLCWFRQQLVQALRDVDRLHSFELDIGIYVTCDEELNRITTQPAPSCGTAQLVTSDSSTPITEKKDDSNNIELRSVRSNSTSPSETEKDGGGCCCRAPVDENNATSRTCSCNPSSSESSSSSPFSDEKAPLSPAMRSSHEKLRIHTGRPPIRSIIRRVLEQADGESAVVACGPRGLQDDVRRSVVALSDERAVHKGTGAQGIYLHVEGFAVG